MELSMSDAGRSRSSFMDSTMSIKITPQKIMQTLAAVELYHAQREVANYLELAYLQLGDHPDVAREVRMTAHAARTQHLMTSGLMKKFTVTAAHIVNTMIPMIIDAIELEDRDIITEAFGQIIENAESMKKESEETRTSYLTIQSQIQANLASVNTRNKHVVDEGKRLKVEMQRQKQMAKAAEMAQTQLDEERAQMEEELETLRSHRDRWMNAAEDAAKDLDKDDCSFLDQALGTTSSMGGTAGAVLGIAKGVVNIFSSLFGANKKETKYKEMINAYRENENSVLRVMTQRRVVIERRNQQRGEALERLSTLKQLSLEQAGLGNVESLREASLYLGDVDKQFTRIILFWENMAGTLKYLKEDVRSGEVYLKKIENPKYSERFKKSIRKAEKDWKFFGRICSDYVQENDAEIPKLYSFLSAPIDNLAATARVNRQNELMMSIESDIHSAFPDDESSDME